MTASIEYAAGIGDGTEVRCRIAVNGAQKTPEAVVATGADSLHKIQTNVQFEMTAGDTASVQAYHTKGTDATVQAAKFQLTHIA